MLRSLVRAGVPASYLLIPAASYVLPEVRAEKRDPKVGIKGFTPILGSLFPRVTII